MPRHTFELAAPATFADMPPVPGDVPGDGSGGSFPVPEWVHVSPIPDGDGYIDSRDYRRLVVDSMEKLVKRSNAALKRQGGGGLVDKDHRSYGYFSDGTGAIAWAEEYELRADGIYARTMWLPEGREEVSSGKYRYTSMVLNGPQEWVYDENGYPTRLDIFPQEIEGFGITNTPALVTKAMFATEDTMEKKTIEIALSKLGLSPAVVAELSALPIEQLHQRMTAAPATRTMFTTDGEPDPAGDGELEAEVEPEADPVDPPVDAPIVDETAEKLSKAHARIAELEALNSKLTEDAAEGLVASLVHSGKVTPAQRADVLAIAQEPGGIARVTKLYGKATRIVGAAAIRSTAKPTAETAPFGSDPLAIRLAREGKTITEITVALQQRDKERKTQ